MGCLTPVVDLSHVAQDERALIWSGAAREVFPGLSLELPRAAPELGSIERTRIASGELFSIVSAPAIVRYDPSPSRMAGGSFLSLLLQMGGGMEIRQKGHSCQLRPGDLTVLDETCEFRLIGEDCSSFLFLRIPRAAALSRHPGIEKCCASALSSEDPGTGMLTDTLSRLSDHAASLREAHLSTMMQAIIQMLGLIEPGAGDPQGAEWRVARALDFIETNLSVAGLTAEDIARDQRISRRRLDQLMLERIGRSAASHLWARRLDRAAGDLRDPGRSDTSIAQIAFSNGFEDAAHFTRAFKRRFEITPGQWRLN